MKNKKLYIGLYYTDSEQNDKNWILFVAGDEEDKEDAMLKIGKDMGITMTEDDIENFYPITKEEDQDGNSYDVIVKSI